MGVLENLLEQGVVQVMARKIRRLDKSVAPSDADVVVSSMARRWNYAPINL